MAHPGFPSWRALKAEVDRRNAGNAGAFFEACERNDLETIGSILRDDPALVRAADPRARFGGWTALHGAAQRGALDLVRLLLENGADPNAREEGDNTTPLHWAAASGNIEIVRVLLDAGSDPQGAGDLHELDVIGWATYFRGDDIAHDVVALLIERGARHHIISALSVGDADLVRQVMNQQPGALQRRMSRFEQNLTALHFVVERKRHDLLDLLIELGADLQATDGKNRTALDFAMLRGDHEATRRLHAAGARPSNPMTPGEGPRTLESVAPSVSKCIPMIGVPDIAAALEWYTSIGFTERERYADAGLVNFGYVTLGKAELMFGINRDPNRKPLSLWFYTDQVDRLYEILKNRQLDAARQALEGGAAQNFGIVFEEDLYDPFYGGRQFSILDPFGYNLIFYQIDVPQRSEHS